MILDIKTLTKEQHKQLDMGYKIYLNEDNKLVTEEPTVITPEFIEYKTEIINKQFENAVKGIDKSVISNFETEKEAEAKIVKGGGNSTFLDGLVVTGESVADLATEIVDKADLDRTAYIAAEKTKRQKLKDLTI